MFTYIAYRNAVFVSPKHKTNKGNTEHKTNKGFEGKIIEKKNKIIEEQMSAVGDFLDDFVWLYVCVRESEYENEICSFV